MKIAIEARSLTVTQTGIPRYVFNLLNEISKRDSKNEYILLSDVKISDDIIKKFGPNWNNIFMGKIVSRGIQIPSYVRFLKKQCEKELPDVFWAPAGTMPDLNSFKKTKTVVTIHDVIPIEHPEIYKLRRRLYFKHYVKKSLKNADRIIFVSNTVKDAVNRLFDNLIDKKEQFLVFSAFSGIQKQDHTKTESKILDKIGSKYLFFVGTKEKRKGIFVIAHAAELLSFLSIKIVVAGRDGEGIDDFRKQIKGSKNTIELSYLTDEEKNLLLSNASALLFPSLAEGFGIPLIEAASMKKPVIASDLPIFMEVLDGNYFSFRSGDPVALSETIKKFFETDKEIINNIVEKAYQSVKKYDLNIEAQKMFKILTEWE